MVNSLRSAAYPVVQTRYAPSLSNPIATNNAKNSLKVNLQSDLSQHGVSLIDGGRLLLPVIHDGVQRVQRGASSVLIDREVGIPATPHGFPVSLQIAENRDGLLLRPRGHELRGAVHAMAGGRVLNVVDHGDIEHIRVEMRSLRHRREHAVLVLTPASHSPPRRREPPPRRTRGARRARAAGSCDPRSSSYR